MVKYRSNTYYLFDRLVIPIIFIVTIGFLTNRVREYENLYFIGLALISIIIVIMIGLIMKLAKVDFFEDKIVKKRHIPSTTLDIDYLSIIEFQHIHAYNLTSMNIIKYKDRESSKIKKLKITCVVPNTEFIDFAKWIKNKNDRIEFKFFPSDSGVSKEYSKVFNEY